MKGGENKQPLGYTILEVMIVLAVSGVMFLIAASFINGKQEKAAFTNGVNQFASTIQDTINEVTDGQYSDIPVDCSFNGTTTISAGTNPNNYIQGQNAPCVFLGKVLHLSYLGGQSNYEVLTVAGGRVDNLGNPITNLTGADNADPKVVIPTPDSLTIYGTVPQGLDVNNVLENGSTNSYAIGFFQTQGTSDGEGGLQDGPQTVGMYYINGLDSSANKTFTFSPTYPLSTYLTPATSVDICLSDGVQYADIKLGDSGSNASQLSVSVVKYGTSKPAGICV